MLCRIVLPVNIIGKIQSICIPQLLSHYFTAICAKKNMLARTCLVVHVKSSRMNCSHPCTLQMKYIYPERFNLFACKWEAEQAHRQGSK